MRQKQRKSMIITQNGAKSGSYEGAQDTLALLKILDLGSQQVERDELTPIGEVASRLRGCTHHGTLRPR
jgi:hypothetical protein